MSKLYPVTFIATNTKWSDTVNELSNTIELVPILTRAESLFRRFERTVQAVDKKHNFPAPQIRQRLSSQSANEANPISSPANSTSPQRPINATASSSGTDSNRNNNNVGKQVARGTGPEQRLGKEKVISPELRQLLSRDIVTLDKHQISGQSRESGTPSSAK